MAAGPLIVKLFYFPMFPPPIPNVWLTHFFSFL
jgi:hypothetical protein